MQAENHRQLQPPLTGSDVTDITGPFLVGFLGDKVFLQQVRCDLERLVPVSRGLEFVRSFNGWHRLAAALRASARDGPGAEAAVVQKALAPSARPRARPTPRSPSPRRGDRAWRLSGNLGRDAATALEILGAEGRRPLPRRAARLGARPQPGLQLMFRAPSPLDDPVLHATHLPATPLIWPTRARDRRQFPADPAARPHRFWNRFRVTA